MAVVVGILMLFLQVWWVGGGLWVVVVGVVVVGWGGHFDAVFTGVMVKVVILMLLLMLILMQFLGAVRLLWTCSKSYNNKRHPFSGTEKTHGFFEFQG